MRNDAVKLFYSKPELFKQNFKGYLTNVVKHYQKFAGHFKLTGTKYSCGEEITSADFHLWEMLDQHELLAKAVGADSILGNFPRLQKFQQDFGSHLSKLRINNTMATFGFSDANTILPDASC